MKRTIFFTLGFFLPAAFIFEASAAVASPAISVSPAVSASQAVCASQGEVEREAEVFLWHPAGASFALPARQVACTDVPALPAMQAAAETQTATFYVKALENEEKAKAVQTQLYAVKGVTEVKCNLITRTVQITYRVGETSKTRLASAFRKIGLEALAVDSGAGCPVPPAKQR